jgi:hypothetical protein
MPATTFSALTGPVSGLAVLPGRDGLVTTSAPGHGVGTTSSGAGVVDRKERRGVMREAHIADHLWLVEFESIGAWFETRTPDGSRIMDRDIKTFPCMALACRAYREGYAPHVRYPH